MDSDEEALRKFQRGRLAKRIQEETEDITGRQEAQAIEAVMKVLSSGGTLDPQFAVQQWLLVFSVRRFRKALERTEREGVSSGTRVKNVLDVSGS